MQSNKCRQELYSVHQINSNFSKDKMQNSISLTLVLVMNFNNKKNN